MTLFQLMNSILFLALLYVVKGSDVEYDGQLTFLLEHALDHVPEPAFVTRGTVNVQSIRSGVVQLSQPPLTDVAKHKLKQLASVDGFYRLKLIVQGGDSKEKTYLTFAKACSILESHLSDNLVVTLDHSGAVVGVSLSASPGVCKGAYVPDIVLDQFNTSVFVQHMDQGPVPETASYIQRIEQEKLARERGEAKDNRSFFAKYWMYIVPVIIFMLFSGSASPEGAGGR